MITRSTIVVDTGPLITAEQFQAILVAAGSPAAPFAKDCYQVIVKEGIEPAFILSIFKKESGYATDPASMVVKYKTFNPGNCRSSTIGPQEVIQTEKGPFVRYKNWQDGFRDAANRLNQPGFDYAKAGAVTIDQIIHIWAPFKDMGNDPVGYLTTVVKLMNQWIGEASTTMTLKIALAAGHHNNDGGSPVEAAITGPLCHFYAMAFRDAGCDVRVLTPSDGLGQYPGGLQDVAQKVVDWSNAGWTADLFLECHTQGLGDTTVRGCFAIYPDWGSDLDATVKNGLGLAMVKAISVATGIPVWWSGLMSEKATGVGLGGDRLGIFLRTAPIAAKTTRLIVEHGSHSNPQDLALLQNPAIQQKIAQAGAKAAIDYFGQGGAAVTPVYDPCMDYFNAHGGEAVFGKPIGGQYGTNGSVERMFTLAHFYLDKTTNQVVVEMIEPALSLNGHIVAHGFKDYFEKQGGVKFFGLPLTEEQTNPRTGLTEQCFERYVLEYDAKADPDWQVRGKDIGRFYLTNRGF